MLTKIINYFKGAEKYSELINNENYTSLIFCLDWYDYTILTSFAPLDFLVIDIISVVPGGK